MAFAKWISLILLATASTALSAEPLKFLEMTKSTPVEVNGLQFVATTQAQWVAKPGGSELPIEIQLLITNKTKTDLLFRTFDTFAPKLKTAFGMDVPWGGERDGTSLSLPVLIRAGATYCLSRTAELWWKLRLPASLTIPDGKGGTIPWEWHSNNRVAGFGLNPDGRCGLLYWDGTGMVHSYHPLIAGSYGLYFSIASDEKEAAREALKTGESKVWSGQVETSGFVRDTGRIQLEIPLVPKLHWGTHLSAQLHCAGQLARNRISRSSGEDKLPAPT